MSQKKKKSELVLPKLREGLKYKKLETKHYVQVDIYQMDPRYKQIWLCGTITQRLDRPRAVVNSIVVAHVHQLIHDHQLSPL